MKNKDLLKEENKELMQALSQALKEDDEDAMAEQGCYDPCITRNQTADRGRENILPGMD